MFAVKRPHTEAKNYTCGCADGGKGGHSACSTNQTEQDLRNGTVKSWTLLLHSSQRHRPHLAKRKFGTIQALCPTLSPVRNATET